MPEQLSSLVTSSPFTLAVWRKLLFDGSDFVDPWGIFTLYTFDPAGRWLGSNQMHTITTKHQDVMMPLSETVYKVVLRQGQDLGCLV